jgi:hypothetical protein
MNIKISDDKRTVTIDGEIYTKSSTPVTNPFIKNIIEDTPKYTLEYCINNRVAIKCLTTYEWGYVRNAVKSTTITPEQFTPGDIDCISTLSAECAPESFYIEKGFVIVMATQFIHDNYEPPIDETQYAWQKHYEILSFQNKAGDLITLRESGGYNVWPDTPKSNVKLKAMLEGVNSVEDGEMKIHSIRRKADNIIFSVADKVECEGEVFCIKSINIKEFGFILRDTQPGSNTDADFCTPYVLPTLQEIFKKNDSRYIIDNNNDVQTVTTPNEGIAEHQNTLKAPWQCKQIQTHIALQNIADYYNNVVGWIPKQDEIYYFIARNCTNATPRVFQFTMNDDFVFTSLLISFKSPTSAEQAIEILEKADLLKHL